MSDGMDGLSGLSGFSEEDDWIPDGLRKLGEKESDYSDNERLNPRIRVNKFHSQFQSDLDSGKGRDDLVEYVWDQFEDEYSVGEIVELQVYLLDELDRKGEMIGKDVFEYVKEFEDQEGSPDYLKDYSTRVL